MNNIKSLLSSLSSKFDQTSYSQCGEDVLVDFIFKNLLKISKPTFLDIGANDPIKFNNTFKLYRAGSIGINIDPNRESIKLFNKKRKCDININCGIGKERGVKILYIFNNSMLNTFDEEVARIQGGIIATEEVQIETIANILRKNHYSGIPDFLSLDTEGMDMEILESIYFLRNQLELPKVICVETIQKIGDNEWQKDREIIEYLKGIGYIHHSDTFINSIFVHPKHLKVKIR